MFRVLVYFTDLLDNDYPYKVGDTYPRKGLKPTKKRIEELSSDNNLRKVKLIEKVEEQEDEPKPKSRRSKANKA